MKKLQTENKNLKAECQQLRRESRKSIASSERVQLDKEDLIEFIREIDHKLSQMHVDLDQVRDSIRIKLVDVEPRLEHEMRLNEKRHQVRKHIRTLLCHRDRLISDSTQNQSVSVNQRYYEQSDEVEANEALSFEHTLDLTQNKENLNQQSVNSQNIVPLDKHVVAVSNDGICFEMEFAPQNISDNQLEKACRNVILTPKGTISQVSKSFNSDMFRPVMISSRQSDRV